MHIHITMISNSYPGEALQCVHISNQRLSDYILIKTREENKQTNKQTKHRKTGIYRGLTAELSNTGLLRFCNFVPILRLIYLSVSLSWMRWPTDEYADLGLTTGSKSVPKVCLKVKWAYLDHFIYLFLFITFGNSQTKPNIEQAIN